jgi:hypothetical protein
MRMRTGRIVEKGPPSIRDSRRLRQSETAGVG